MTVPTLTSKPSRMPGEARLRWSFAEWFILSQTFLPALLYLPGTQPLRIPIRVAAYGISLAALAYYSFSPARRSQLTRHLHPSVLCLSLAIGYLTLMLVHPSTNSLLAGLGQIFLYLAILSPILWAQGCVSEPRRLQRLLWLLLLCNGINSFVGVMQVRDPATWMPHELSSSVMEGEFGLGTSIYEGADGTMIIRPPGLGDAPGAVAGPGVFALYLGVVFAVADPKWWKKAVAVVFAALGAEAIFLSLVRSSFLIAVGMLGSFFLIQLARGRTLQAGALLLIAAAAISLAFLQSSSTGGENLVERFKTIVADNPLDFYYENRGNQVEQGFGELLPTYPLGAGLGRYGMMNVYFGNSDPAAAPPIWVEIQWPAWIVDGGIILCLLYPIALGAAIWQQVKIAFHGRNEEEQQLGSIILAASGGVVALCFSYPVFLSPLGVQFWFLAGALHGISLAGKNRSDDPTEVAARTSPEARTSREKRSLPPGSGMPAAHPVR